MEFKFETGEVITCNDESIAKLLRADKRYTEVTKVREKAPKKAQKEEVQEVAEDKPLQ